MPLHHGQLEDVLGGVGEDETLHRPHPLHSLAGDYLPGDDLYHRLGIPGDGQPQRIGSEGLDAHRLGQLGGVGLGGGEQWLALFGHRVPPVEHSIYGQAGQVVEDDDIGKVAGGYRPQPVQPEVLGGVDGRHLNRPHRVQPLAYRQAHHGVYIPVLEQVGAAAVVHHEQAPLIVVIGDQGQQGVQVLLRGALPYHNIHPPLQLLLRLLQDGALVVGAYAGGDVGVQVFTPHPGGMAVDDPAPGELQLAQHILVAAEDAGEVHHLPQPNAALPAQKLGYSLRLQAGAGRLQVCGRDA